MKANRFLLAGLLCVGLASGFFFYFKKSEAAVYDCFMFNNELDILEIRLNEMAPYVDHFVLVEWDRTIKRGDPKPCYFEANQDRFKAFANKIIHIRLRESPDELKLDVSTPHRQTWCREIWHRDQIMRGLTRCRPNDIVLISDVDEIIPGSLIPQLKQALNEHKMIGLVQQFYRWFLNYSASDCQEGWNGSIAVRYQTLRRRTPQMLREISRFDPRLFRIRAGWHFSSMGGYQEAKTKYFSIVEAPDDFFPDAASWRTHVGSTSRVVLIDHSYPQFVQDNVAYLKEKGLIEKSSAIANF